MPEAALFRAQPVEPGLVEPDAALRSAAAAQPGSSTPSTLPQPEGPSRAMNSPRFTTRSTLFKALRGAEISAHALQPQLAEIACGYRHSCFVPPAHAKTRLSRGLSATLSLGLTDPPKRNTSDKLSCEEPHAGPSSQTCPPPPPGRPPARQHRHAHHPVVQARAAQRLHARRAGTRPAGTDAGRPRLHPALHPGPAKTSTISACSPIRCTRSAAPSEITPEGTCW